MKIYSGISIDKIFLFHCLPESKLHTVSEKIFFSVNSHSHIEIIKTLYPSTLRFYFISSVLSNLNLKHKSNYSYSKKIVEDFIRKNNYIKCKILRLGPINSGFDDPAFKILGCSIFYASKKIYSKLNEPSQIYTIPIYWNLVNILVKTLTSFRNLLTKK